uniref:Regulation of nuclear pre-mRNA domain-containing protein 2 n=1 Tax=Lygus hesperus TaxID=30085 RepID=A0A0A9WFB6_LYGHE
MDEVDQELFLEMLLKLDGSHESIKAASKWCRANAQYHQDVVRMWFFAVAKARTMIRRLDLFHLASDILFTAEAQSVNYFSSFLPQLVKAIPLVRGEEIKLSMKKLFSLWREKNIYNKPVMDRLGKLLRNRNKVVDMNVFRYDRELLFKNLNRIQDLKPACDYLMKGMEHAPSFDDSPRLLSTIKERRACNNLLSVVDSHKTKVTSLVSYLEEMVHLLKMATATLDIAANREQNGIEETKLKILAYGRYNEKVLSLLHRLESNYNIPKKDAVVPMTPLSPDPEESTLFSRRDVSLLDSPASPVISLSTVSTWSPQAAGFGVSAEPEIFHRRESYGGITQTRDNPKGFDTPYAPTLGSRTPTRDPYPNRSIPALEQYPPNLVTLTPTGSAFPPALASRTPTRETFPSTLGSRTPTREEPSWYPASPSYSGTSSWGQTQPYSTHTGPVYQKWYTGINQTTDCSSPRRPSNPPSLLSIPTIPFTTFMGPSTSGYTKK